MDPVDELDDYAVRLRRWHESAVTGGEVEDGAPRRLISASWRRSLDAGIDPEIRSAPLAYEQSDMRDIRLAHPLNPLLPLLAQTLLPLADQTGHVMVVTDAQGRVLWREGDHATMRRADGIGLTDGFDWGENAVGTNGIGTALAARRSVHVFSSEHLVRVLHPWSCSASPIIDPDTSEVLGCVDISGTFERLHPSTVALVDTTARLAESHLALRARERDDRLRARYESHVRTTSGQPHALVTRSGRIIAGDPARRYGSRIRVPASGGRVSLPGGLTGVLEPFGDGWLLRPVKHDAPSALTLVLLGTDHPYARLDGAIVQLSLRHAEILALLALNPRGMTAEQLSFHLYGDDGNPVTIRAEIHRLRAQLGAAVAAKPYRLACPVEADFLEVKRLLAVRDPAPLARAYPGPLLPRSEAPAIRREREELEGQVRARILLSGSPEDLWIYAQTDQGRHDPQVLERVATLLPPGDHRAITARLRLTAPE